MKKTFYILLMVVLTGEMLAYSRESLNKNSFFSAKVYRAGNGALYNFQSKPTNNPEAADVIYAGPHPKVYGYTTDVHFIGHIVTFSLLNNQGGQYKQSGYPVKLRISGVDDRHSLSQDGTWKPSVQFWSEKVKGHDKETQGKIRTLRGTVISEGSESDPNKIYSTDENGLVQWLIGSGDIFLYPRADDPNYYSDPDYACYEWPGTYSPSDNPPTTRSHSFVGSRVHFEFEVNSLKNPNELLFFNKSHAVYRRFPGQDAFKTKTYTSMGGVQWPPIPSISYFSFKPADMTYSSAMAMSLMDLQLDDAVCQESYDSTPALDSLIVHKSGKTSSCKYMLKDPWVSAAPFRQLKSLDGFESESVNPQDPNTWAFSIHERFLTRLEFDPADELWYWVEVNDGEAICPMIESGGTLEERLSKTTPYSCFISSESDLPVNWYLTMELESGKTDPNAADPNLVTVLSHIESPVSFHSEYLGASYANTPWVAFSFNPEDYGYHIDTNENYWIVLPVEEESYVRLTWIPLPDYFRDGKIDFRDLDILAKNWLKVPPEVDLSVINWASEDLQVGIEELSLLAQDWLYVYPQ